MPWVSTPIANETNSKAYQNTCFFDGRNRLMKLIKSTGPKVTHQNIEETGVLESSFETIKQRRARLICEKC